MRNKREIEAYCNKHLVELIDKGLEIKVFKDCQIMITNDVPFTWEDIKYDFAPFVEYIKNDYDLVNFGVDKYIKAIFSKRLEVVEISIEKLDRSPFKNMSGLSIYINK